MMLYYKKNHYHFQVLIHDLIFHIGPISETYLNNDNNSIVKKINDFNTNELSKILDNIENGRYSHKLLLFFLLLNYCISRFRKLGNS